jgi:hypothetical protein
MSQVVNKSGSDRIGNTVEHNGNRVAITLQCCHGQCASGHDDVRRECDQFRRVSAIALNNVPAPAYVDPYSAAVTPAQLLQRLLERRDAGLALRIVRDGVHEHTDPPHLLGLLRARREWPRHGGAADKCDKFPTPHGFACAEDTIRYEKNIRFWIDSS